MRSISTIEEFFSVIVIMRNCSSVQSCKETRMPGKPCNSASARPCEDGWIVIPKEKRRVAWAAPKDIVHTFPKEFYDVHEISLLRCTIIGRLLDLVDQHMRPIDTNRNGNKHIRK